MMTKNFATFRAAFPDDSEETADAEVIVPAGRGISTAIANRIPSAGVPNQHSFYGWKFEFKCPSGRRAWALLQQPGPWLLIVEAKTSWLERGSKREAAFAEAVQVIQKALASVPAVSEVGWFTQDEFANSQKARGQ